MPVNRPVFVLLSAFIAAAWILSASFASGIAAQAGKHGKQPAFGTEAAFSASFALVEKALCLPPAPAAVRYIGGVESPFKTVAQARQSEEPGTRAAPRAQARPKLALKGILYKNNPLAILEDANGKTSILGVGDTLNGQKVTAIGKTSVKLRDRHGLYDLSVKE
jgi:hypothetical protein